MEDYADSRNAECLIDYTSLCRSLHIATRFRAGTDTASALVLTMLFDYEKCHTDSRNYTRRRQGIRRILGLHAATRLLIRRHAQPAECTPRGAAIMRTRPAAAPRSASIPLRLPPISVASYPL